MVKFFCIDFRRDFQSDFEIKSNGSSNEKDIAPWMSTDNRLDLKRNAFNCHRVRSISFGGLYKVAS